MKPVLSLVFGLLLAATVLPLYADQGATISEPGVFTYQAPPDWEVKESPMSKYKVAMGPAKNGFAPNINVVTESYDGTLEHYVEANKTAIKDSPMFSNVTFVSQAAFEGANGVQGIRLVTTDTLGKMNLQQIFYFFSGTKGKVVVTASSSIETGDQYTPIFDASLKTFMPL